jgi:hypothetical protein
MFRTKVVDKKHDAFCVRQVLCSASFIFRLRAVCEIICGNTVETDRQTDRKTTDGNMAHAHCVLVN